MTIARQGNLENVTLYVGEVLTVTADSLSNGRVWQLGDVPGSEPQAPTTVNASGTVTFGPYGHVTRFQVDALAGTLTFSQAMPAMIGTVTNVVTGTGLSGGPFTCTGTASLADTAVTPGNYVKMNATVDQQGRVTAAADGPATVTVVGTVGDVCDVIGAGVPVDGTTGANVAGIGSRYCDTVAGKLYINGGTKVSPVWKIVTSAS